MECIARRRGRNEGRVFRCRSPSSRKFFRVSPSLKPPQIGRRIAGAVEQLEELGGRRGEEGCLVGVRVACTVPAAAAGALALMPLGEAATGIAGVTAGCEAAIDDAIGGVREAAGFANADREVIGVARSESGGEGAGCLGAGVADELTLPRIGDQAKLDGACAVIDMRQADGLIVAAREILDAVAHVPFRVRVFPVG